MTRRPDADYPLPRRDWFGCGHPRTAENTQLMAQVAKCRTCNQRRAREAQRRRGWDRYLAKFGIGTTP